ncbi:hypothetical protein BC940DRAFT_55283 [Gongronella butleri]|nr:hypothetical protein BC940DRAFT_55283 [Gongronella butleri]
MIRDFVLVPLFFSSALFFFFFNRARVRVPFFCFFFFLQPLSFYFFTYTSPHCHDYLLIPPSKVCWIHTGAHCSARRGNAAAIRLEIAHAVHITGQFRVVRVLCSVANVVLLAQSPKQTHIHSFAGQLHIVHHEQVI